MPRPWNWLRNSTIHFHICSQSAKYLLMVTGSTLWRSQFYNISSNLLLEGLDCRGFVGINFCTPVLTSTRVGITATTMWHNRLLYIILANKLRAENFNLSPFLLLCFDSQTWLRNFLCLKWMVYGSRRHVVPTGRWHFTWSNGIIAWDIPWLCNLPFWWPGLTA